MGSLNAWYVVLLFSVLSLNQCGVWFGLACADPDVIAGWIPHISKDTIRLSLLIGPLVYFVGFIPTTAIVTTDGGIRKVVYAAHVACVVSAASMCVVASDAVRHSEWTPYFSLLGLTLNVLAGPTAMALCPAIVAEWFPPNKRGFPTSVAIVSNAMGVVVWSPLGPALAPTPEDVPRLFYVHLATTVVPFICCLLYYPHPPKDDSPDMAKIMSMTKAQD
eukprot:PhM_4_TR12428/c1_g1_i1/m.86808